MVEAPGNDNIPPPFPEFATKKEEIRDEQTIRQVEPNGLLELAPLDQSCQLVVEWDSTCGKP